MGQPRSIQRTSVKRSSSVSAWTLPLFTASGGILGANPALVIQGQTGGRLVQLLRMAGDATAIEDRFDVFEKLDHLGSGLITQACLVLGVPLLARLVELFRRHQRRLLGEI